MSRKLMYKTVEELQTSIDAYFAERIPEFIKSDDGKYIFDKTGNPIILRYNHPTVTGLALHLGFTNRQTLLNYQGREKFKDCITIAKTRIEEFSESMLYDPRVRPQGPIFALKNMGWKDTQNLNHAGKDGEELRMTGVMVVPGRAASPEDWEAAGESPAKP